MTRDTKSVTTRALDAIATAFTPVFADLIFDALKNAGLKIVPMGSETQSTVIAPVHSTGAKGAAAQARRDHISMLVIDPISKVLDPRAYINEICARRDISLSHIASGAGVSSSTLTRYMNNHKHKFELSTKTLNKIISWDRKAR